MTLSPGRRFAVALGAELVYLAGRTFIRAQALGEIPTELLVTGWRVAFIVLYVYLYREALRGAWRAPLRRPVHALLWFGIILDLAVVMMAGYGRSVPLDARLVYIATIPAVALREEMFYRFILQDELERRTTPTRAILLASLLFVLFHIGAQPMNLFSVASLAGGALLLGVTYQRTRSLPLVIGIHAAVDLAFMLSWPVLAPAGLLLGHLSIIFIALLAFSLDRSRERMGL